MQNHAYVAVDEAVSPPVEELRAPAAPSERRERKTAAAGASGRHGKRPRPNRAQEREFARRAHTVNLDLGAAAAQPARHRRPGQHGRGPSASTSST